MLSHSYIHQNQRKSECTRYVSEKEQTSGWFSPWGATVALCTGLLCNQVSQECRKGDMDCASGAENSGMESGNVPSVRQKPTMQDYKSCTAGVKNEKSRMKREFPVRF